AGGAGGNVAAQITADQDGGIAEGVPTIDAGGGTGDTVGVADEDDETAIGRYLDRAGVFERHGNAGIGVGMDQVGQATIDAVTENESALIRGARKVGRHLEGHEVAIGAEGMVIGEDVAGADNGINDAARAAADPNGGGSNGGAEVKLARRPDAWDEVGGGARESDVLPIGRDLGRFGTGGEGNGIGVGRAGADEGSWAGLQIA